MSRPHLFAVFFCVALGLASVGAVGSAEAQDAPTISGTVTDAESGEPLPGVNVSVPGTSTGTSTDADGAYRLRVDASADSLLFSFVGYQSRRVAIEDRTTIDVALRSEAVEAEELVVTALGVERDEQTIGYSVQEVGGAEIEETADINVLNSLQWKLSGVSIQQSGTGAGGSTRIVIRGNRNIGSSNQPLFVVDGIPIQGQGAARTGEFGGVDLGGGISDLDPRSIEDISVLRGANAAALYGQEGANGAVVIETKKGTTDPEVTFSTRASTETPLVLPDLQNTYGRGSGGTVCGASTCGDTPDVISGDQSWGARMEGQTIEDWTGEEVPYRAQPGNVEDFFDTPYSTTNSLSFSTGTDSITARAAITDLRSGSLLPGGTFERTNLSLASSADVTDRLSVDGRVSYVTQSAFNRPQTAQSPDNVVFNMYHFPRNLRLQDLRPFEDAEGETRIWTDRNLARRNNPYWAVNLNTNQDSRERMLGYLRLRYELAPWLNASLRGGTDYSSGRREARVASNTVYKTDGLGEYEVERNVSQTTTYDFLLDAEHDLTDDLFGRVLAGGSWKFENGEASGTSGRGLSVDGLFTPSNLESQTPIYGFSEKEIRSLYSLAELRYKSYLFLELTARNDWSSTLPSSNNSYFYPSGTLGFVFSDLIDWAPLSFGKLRASAAGVGSDTQPYATQLGFTVTGDGQSGRPFGSAPTVRPPVDLKPEITRSYEGGLDLGFFDDRVEFNGTYYRTNTRNQIISLDLPPASGFRQGTINAGNIRNQGIELRAQGTALQAGDFRWDVSANWAKNWSQVVELTPSLNTLPLSSSFGVTVRATEGEPFGQITGESFARTDDGRRIIGDDGLPRTVPAADSTTLGNVQPDWTGGLSNTFRYKGLSLRVLLDVQSGGDIYSLSNSVAARQGTAAFTVEGREAWYSGEGGYVADGVVNTGSEDNPTYEENTQAVDPQDYWNEVSSIAEAFVYDGSYVKLREVVLSYSLPDPLLARTPIKQASVSLVGRNLANLYKDTPGFDPESSIGPNLSDQGREAFAFPQTRSYGMNLNLTF
ncbi:MAG: SusC/RagA family TonB-linked outer membrane protein [Salinivenus sp.]